MKTGTIVVTGASAGFGTALVHRYARSGWRVVAAARRTDRLEDLRAAHPRLVYPLTIDVTDAEAVRAAFTDLPADFATVDVVVNNAGLALGAEPAYRAALGDWATMIATNCNGVVNVTHALLPGLVERQRGHIINMGSVAGTHAYPGGNVYGATKAFVHQFSHNLRADLAGTPIRVTLIEPGTCAGTEFSRVRYHGDRDQALAVYDGFDAIVAEDIADAVWWTTSAPPHLDITRIEMMPTAQTPAGFAVHRTGAET
ncbi:MAG: SDR family NAD(P)-dependent oxidoreductase [Deltaproteobacteria bacterium]|nr:SDR family NAD(P)-dependent oxidoreductase [Deltaproteobacteria bacterium]